MSNPAAKNPISKPPAPEKRLRVGIRRFREAAMPHTFSSPRNTAARVESRRRLPAEKRTAGPATRMVAAKANAGKAEENELAVFSAFFFLSSERDRGAGAAASGTASAKPQCLSLRWAAKSYPNCQRTDVCNLPIQAQAVRAERRLRFFWTNRKPGEPCRRNPLRPFQLSAPESPT